MSLSKPKGVRFSEEELARLKTAAAAFGISENDLIRKLIDKGLSVLEAEQFDMNFKQVEFDRKQARRIPSHSGAEQAQAKTKQAAA